MFHTANEVAGVYGDEVLEVDGDRIREKMDAMKMRALLKEENGFESFMFHLAQVW